MVGHCNDESVIGSDFYVMEKVDGTILRRELPVRAAAREQASDAVRERPRRARRAALGRRRRRRRRWPALGRGDGYVDRQVAGWIDRFGKARTDDTGDWSDVIAWLEEHQPGDVGQRLIHNDFRFDNMVLDADDPLRVVGVLDWEMATVGDPLMDLGGTLAYWVEPGDDEFFQMFRRQPTTDAGHVDPRRGGRALLPTGWASR